MALVSRGIAVEAKHTKPEPVLDLGLEKIRVAPTARSAGKTPATADVSGGIESNSSRSDGNRILTAPGDAVPGMSAGGKSIVESFSPVSVGLTPKAELESASELWQSLLELALDSGQGGRVEASD
jgi:hypothetical protein